MLEWSTELIKVIHGRIYVCNFNNVHHAVIMGWSFFSLSLSVPCCRGFFSLLCARVETTFSLFSIMCVWCVSAIYMCGTHDMRVLLLWRASDWSQTLICRFFLFFFRRRTTVSICYCSCILLCFASFFPRRTVFENCTACMQQIVNGSVSWKTQHSFQMCWKCIPYTLSFLLSHTSIHVPNGLYFYCIYSFFAVFTFAVMAAAAAATAIVPLFLLSSIEFTALIFLPGILLWLLLNCWIQVFFSYCMVFLLLCYYSFHLLTQHTALIDSVNFFPLDVLLTKCENLTLGTSYSIKHTHTRTLVAVVDKTIYS